MVSGIISGVCRNLAKEFGDDVKIYSDDNARKEGVLDSKTPLREPNFFVSCKNPSSRKVKDRYFTNTRLLGNRYLRSAALCIECRWFPDWEDVLERLFLCLEYVRVESDESENATSTVRGNTMQGEYVDDVLNFFVSYDFFVYHEEEKQLMEKLIINKEEMLWR